MSISFSALSSSNEELKIACYSLHKITEIAEAILQYCRCNILNVQGSKHYLKQRSKTLIGASGFGGKERWNGMVEWISGMEYWNAPPTTAPL